MSMFLDSTIKVSIVMLLGLGVARLLARQSAAVRHWVLATTILCAMVVPVIGPIVPAWPMPSSAFRPAPATVQPPVAAPRPTGALPGVFELVEEVDARAVTTASWPSAGVVAVRAWIVGAGLSFVMLLTGVARLAWIAWRSERLSSGAWPRIVGEIEREYGLRRPVRLLRTDHASLLVTWGLLQPKVLIPHAAEHWPDERIRIVLRHELAHIKRGDWIVQIAGEVLRSAYWFNPLLWLVCSRLREESEQACDDEVLTGGVAAPDYAAHLLDVARTLKLESAPRLPAPAIARSSRLERRFRAMLNAHLIRTPTTRPFRFITAGALLSATVIVAAAQTGPSTLSGSVLDASGAPVPGASVVLTNKTTEARFEVKTDDRGQFQFVPLPADSYAIEAQLPGFKKATADVQLSGPSVRRDLMLELGSLTETVSITGGPANIGFQVSPDRSAPKPIEQDLDRAALRRDLEACTPSGMGGRIRPPRKIRDVRPTYPENLQALGIGGTVQLGATIGADGTIKDLQVIKSVHPDLDAAAIDAVRQWQFDGTLLNCVPSEVSMTVSLNFSAK
jgi:TonB family protein